MNYRIYERQDQQQVEALCRKYHIALPFDSVVYVAEQDGKIIGIAGIMVEGWIEPLISENPVASVKLYKRTIKELELLGFNKVKIMCDPKYEKLYNKVGFKRIGIDKILMEKEIQDGKK